MQRAAGYCRLSFAPDGSVEKVERQEQDIRKLAKTRGWELLEVYVDNNKSAWSRTRRRPGWQQLLDGIRAGRYDVVVVYHLDRLMRQPYDLEELISLADKQRITLASPHSSRNLDSPDDRFVLRIEVAQACREVDNISRRSTRGWQARAEQGAARGNGIRAYGWERDGRTVNRHEAAIIRRVARQLIDGRSYTSIVNSLNDAGEVTSAGKRWTISTLRTLMGNPRLIGKRVYKGLVVADGQWRPILTAEVFEAVQYVMSGRRAAYPAGARPRTRRYLLSGLARCGECTAPMYVRTPSAGSSGNPAYTCTACRKVSRSLPLVDEYVIRLLLAYLEAQPSWPQPDLVDAGRDQEIAALKTRIDGTLAEFADDDTVTPADLRKILAPMKAQLAVLEKARAELVVRRPRQLLDGAGDRRVRWDALPLADRRQIIADEVDVVVGRSKERGGRNFDYSTILVTPKSDS